MNIVNNETKENIAETCSGEDKGVKDENKIVPINKASSADSENAASTAELAAQLVAQYASQPLAQAVGQPIPLADSQAFAQAANLAAVYNAAQTAAQAQLAIHAAGLSAGQPVAAVSAQTESKPAAAGSAQAESQTIAAASAKTEAQTMTEPSAQTGFTNTTDDEPASKTSSDSAANSVGYTEMDDDSEHSRRIRRFFRSEPEDDFDFDEEERPKKRFFRFRSASEEESRDKLILSRIKDEDLMEYLALEQRRIEFLQQAKEAKEKRILIAFQLLISLAAIVAITYLLQDNPTILISILYIVGIVAALNVWKNPHDKGRKR